MKVHVYSTPMYNLIIITARNDLLEKFVIFYLSLHDFTLGFSCKREEFLLIMITYSYSKSQTYIQLC